MPTTNRYIASIALSPTSSPTRDMAQPLILSPAIGLVVGTPVVAPPGAGDGMITGAPRRPRRGEGEGDGDAVGGVFAIEFCARGLAVTLTTSPAPSGRNSA